MQRKRIHKCFTISIIPKKIEKTNKRILDYYTNEEIIDKPSLMPSSGESVASEELLSTNITSLRYKEQESPVAHIDEVSKNVGEQG